MSLVLMMMCSFRIDAVDTRCYCSCRTNLSEEETKNRRFLLFPIPRPHAGRDGAAWKISSLLLNLNLRAFARLSEAARRLSLSLS